MGIYQVIKNNFKRSFHHKLLFVATFLIPVFLCLLIGMVKFGKTTIQVGILYSDTCKMNTAERDELYNLLNQSKEIKFARAHESTLNTDLMTGKFQVVLDYRESNSINNFILLSYQKEGKNTLIKNIFRESFTNRVPIHLTGLKKEGLSKTERMMAILISMFMIFSAIYSSAMIKDRQNGLIQRYQFAKKNQKGYLAGYMIYNFLITFLQTILCMVVLMLVQKDLTLGYMKGFIMAIIIALISAVFSTLICLGSKSEVQANITASAIAGVMSLLGGTFVAVESMPGLLRILSFASPVRWVVELIRIL